MSSTDKTKLDASTNLDTPSTLVLRDSSGNFSAGTITANLTGNASGSSASFTGSLSGDVTGTQSATVVSQVGGKTASDVAAATGTVDAATNLDTPSTLVKRDSSGNFSATTITANVTGNVSGSSASFTGSLSGDVTGTQSATAISSPTVTGKVLTGYAIGANTPIAATDSILTAFEKVQGQLTATENSAITSLTGDVTATGPGAAASTISAGAVTESKASLAGKPAVSVVATTNQTLSGFPTIDGQTVSAISVVLCTAQTTASQNGPWQAASGAWTRPVWYQSGSTTQAFQFITTLVRLGTTYQGSVWRCTTSGTITIDTTSTTWTVTPVSGNFKANFVLGTQTGSSEVDLQFANSNVATLGWNPTATQKILLPPALASQPGSYLQDTGSGVLAWTNPLVSIDGGSSSSNYTSGQFINGGTA